MQGGNIHKQVLVEIVSSLLFFLYLNCWQGELTAIVIYHLLKLNLSGENVTFWESSIDLPIL